MGTYPRGRRRHLADELPRVPQIAELVWWPDPSLLRLAGRLPRPASDMCVELAGLLRRAA